MAMPEVVQDIRLCLALGPDWQEARPNKALERLRRGGCVGSYRKCRWRYFPGRIYGEVRECCLCIALFPKEIIAWHRHTEARYEFDTRKTKGSGSTR